MFAHPTTAHLKSRSSSIGSRTVTRLRVPYGSAIRYLAQKGERTGPFMSVRNKIAPVLADGGPGNI
jgi:hypothetical protein